MSASGGRVIHRALHQPILFAGAERKPGLMLTLACVGLAMNGATLVAAGLAAGLWLAVFPFLRQAAKADPLMGEVYLRFVRLRGYYAPRSTPWCNR